MAESDLVELVSLEGDPIGQSSVAAAHRAPGVWHRAFSVVIHDDGNRVLLQRRSRDKLRFPGAWANSCCGHVAPGVTPTQAAVARAFAELGAEVVDVRPVGTFTYQAADPASGMVEREYDHVLLARLAPGAVLDPDPAEVAEIRWSPMASWQPGPEDAPWLAGVLEVAAATLPVAGH